MQPCSTGVIRNSQLRYSRMSITSETKYAPAAQRRNLNSPTRKCGERVVGQAESASADGTRFETVPKPPIGAKCSSRATLKASARRSNAMMSLLLGCLALCLGKFL